MEGSLISQIEKANLKPIQMVIILALLENYNQASVIMKDQHIKDIKRIVKIIN